MGHLPVIADVFRCVFNWTSDAGIDHPVSVQHFKDVGSGPDDVATLIDDNTVVHMFEGLPGAVEATSVDITPLDGVSAASHYPLSNWQGESGSGDHLIGQAIIVDFQTGLRGPRHRGRIFLPSPLESVVTSGAIVAANATEIGNAWSDYIAAIAGAGGEFGVASYVHHDFTPYITAKVNQRLGRIKRRQPRS